MIKKIGISILSLVIFSVLLSQVYAQTPVCEMASSETNTVPVNPLLGTIDNAAQAVDGNTTTASSLKVTVNIAGSGTVTQTLIFPTLSAANDSATLLMGYGGSAVQNLAGVANLVTIETFNNGVSNADAQNLSGGLIKAGTTSNTFTYGFRTALQYDAIKLSVTPGTGAPLGASFQLDIYYGCKGPYPVVVVGDDLCSNASSVNTSTSATCVGCGIANPNFAIDNSTNTSADITVPVGLANATATLDVGGFPTTGNAGDSVEVILGIDAALLNAGTNAVTVETFNMGQPNNDAVALNSQVVQAVGNNKSLYTFRPSKIFDQVRVTAASQAVAVGLASDVKVYGVCKKDFRASPFTGGDICIGGDSTADESTGLSSVENPTNVIDADATNFSVLNVPIGALALVGMAQQYVRFFNAGCPGDTIKFVIQDDNGAIASASATGVIRYQTFLGTTLVESFSRSTNIVTGAQAAQKVSIQFATTAPYDGFKLILEPGSTAAANYRLRFYSVCAKPKTPPTLDSAASDLNVCFGGTATLVVNSPNGTTVEWYSDAQTTNLIFTGSPFVTPALTQNTTYYAKTVLSGSGGCSSNFVVAYTVVVQRQLPAPTFVISQVAICENTSVTLNANLPVLSPPLTNATIKWYDAPQGGNLLTTSNTYNTPVLNQTTTYYVETDSAGCISTRLNPPIVQRTPITVIPQSKVNGPVVSCAQTGDINEVAFEWTVVGNATSYNVLRDGTTLNVGLATRYETTIDPSNPFATISVVAATSDVCMFSKEAAPVTCSYVECAPIDVDFVALNPKQCLPAKVQFFDNTRLVNSWLWEFGDGQTSTLQNPEHEYTEPGIFSVTLKVGNAADCFETETRDNFVEICAEPNIFFPGGFTPNGDGLNDEFIVKGGGVEIFKLEIYNQLGQRVFNTGSIEKGWDGKFEGDNQPEGVFVYRAFVKLLEEPLEKEFKGNITLVR